MRISIDTPIHHRQPARLPVQRDILARSRTLGRKTGIGAKNYDILDPRAGFDSKVRLSPKLPQFRRNTPRFGENLRFLELKWLFGRIRPPPRALAADNADPVFQTDYETDYETNKENDMRRTRVTLAQTMKTWDTLNTAIKPLMTDLPTAVKVQVDFEASIGRVKGLSMTQDGLTGQVRDTVKARRAEEETAKALYDRLAAHLQAKFGPKSDLLLQFAVRPRRHGGGRRKKVTPPAPQSPQPEAPTPVPASQSKP